MTARDDAVARRVEQLLVTQWPHVTFEVGPYPQSSTDGRAVKVHWVDGPVSREVEAAVQDVWPQLQVVPDNVVSLRTVALGVQLDYRAAADGRVNIYATMLSWRDGVPFQGLLQLADPWETHEDRNLADLAQMLADLARTHASDNSGSSTAVLAQVLVDAGGLAGLRQIHRTRNGTTRADGNPAR